MTSKQEKSHFKLRLKQVHDIWSTKNNCDKQLLPNITEGFSVRFGAYGKDWDAGCWAKWTKEWIWNVSKVRVTMLNRAQWSSGHMQGCCSVGAWVQQNVWILHKPKEGGKNSGTSRQESQHSLVSALMRMVSAAQHAWDYACLRVCVIITRCTSAVVCGFQECLGMAAGKQAESRRFEPYMLPDPLSSWRLQRNCHLTSQRLQSCNISIIRSYSALQLLPEKKQC